MNFSSSYRIFFKLVGSFSVCFFGLYLGFAQEPPSKSQSFDRLEARIQQMRSKFEAIGKQSPPSSGLLVPDSSRVVDSAPGVSVVSDSETPSSVSEPKENQVLQNEEAISESSMQSEFGSYYFQVFCGYVVPSEVRLRLAPPLGDKMLEADSAYQLGLSGGKRFGNWMTELQFSYGVMDYDGFVDSPFSFLKVLKADGEGTSMDVALNISYSALLTSNFWIYLGGGGGLTYREDNYFFIFSSHPHSPIPFSSKSTVFSYNAFLGVGYGFNDLISLRLGYRYAGIGSNNEFGSLRNHVFEGALGASF